MKKWLSIIRMPDKNIKLSTQITYSILTLLLGIALGVFSKWLDTMAIDDTILWQHILEMLDLRNIFSDYAIWLLIALTISIYSKTPLRASINVFLFFVGMCSSYHLYTIVFAGFNPQNYMMIWYGFTLLSPVLAFICWYGKGQTKFSLLIAIFILATMLTTCFSIGFWYFHSTSIINTLIFIGSAAVLYITPKYTLISLMGALILSLVI